jgi:hypothetical protein
MESGLSAICRYVVAPSLVVRTGLESRRTQMNRFGRFLVAGGLGAGSASFAQGWCVCRRRHWCGGPRVCRSAGYLCAAARHLRSAGDIWTAPLARILSLSLLVRRISRLLRPRLLRPWLLRPWLLRASRLLWTWALRASRVAPLERASDRFRTTPTRSKVCTGRSSRTSLPDQLACVADTAMPRCKHTVAARVKPTIRLFCELCHRE